MYIFKSGTTSLKKNAVLNVFKQCSNIIFPLLTFPYISRVLGADNLGRYSFVDSLIQILVTVAVLGIPTYAVREGARIRNDYKEIEQFSAELFTISLFSMLIVYFFLFVLLMYVPRIKSDSVLVVILSFNILATVLGRDWINSIYENYIYITARQFLFQFVSLFTIFLVIRNQDDYIKYAAIMLISNSGGFILNLLYLQKKIPLRITLRLHLKKHLKPIFLLFCSSLAITIYVKSDIFLIGLLSTNKEVGIYTLASKIYIVIKSVLNAIILVVIPRAANLLGSGRFSEYYNILSELKKILYTLIFPAIIGLFVLSKSIILLIGGKGFYLGYNPLRILSIALFCAVFNCFYAQCVLVINRKENIFFIATVISSVVNIILNIILIPRFGASGAAFTTLVAEIVVLIICKFNADRYLRLKKDKDMKSVFVGSIIIALICILVNKIFSIDLLKIIVSFIFSLVAYTIVLFLMKNSLFEKINNR